MTYSTQSCLVRRLGWPLSTSVSEQSMTLSGTPETVMQLGRNLPEILRRELANSGGVSGSLNL
jgi:hypothetical protein